MVACQSRGNEGMRHALQDIALRFFFSQDSVYLTGYMLTIDSGVIP